MTDRVPSLRDRIKSDLIALASICFSAGVFVILTTVYFAKGDMIGWIFGAGALVQAGGAIFVGRRVLSRIP